MMATAGWYTDEIEELEPLVGERVRCTRPECDTYGSTSSHNSKVNGDDRIREGRDDSEESPSDTGWLGENPAAVSRINTLLQWKTGDEIVRQEVASHQSATLEEALGNLCLEITYPSCAGARIFKTNFTNEAERSNKCSILPSMWDPTDWYSLRTGSRAEGLALEDGWGQNPADIDTMHVHKATGCVSVDRRPDDAPGLELDSENVPHGFQKVICRNTRKWINGFEDPTGKRHKFFSMLTSLGYFIIYTIITRDSLFAFILALCAFIWIQVCSYLRFCCSRANCFVDCGKRNARCGAWYYYIAFMGMIGCPLYILSQELEMHGLSYDMTLGCFTIISIIFMNILFWHLDSYFFHIISSKKMQGEITISWSTYQMAFSKRRFAKRFKKGPSMPASSKADNVTCLLMSRPLELVDQFFLSQRPHWPPRSALQVASQLPLMLVPTGPDDESWRCSWSLIEMVLVRTIPLNVRQAYWAFKYCMNSALRKERRSMKNNSPVEQFSNKKFSSYIFKNVLLWALGDLHFGNSPFECFKRLIDKLKASINCHDIPHYFNPNINLLTKISLREVIIAKTCVSNISKDLMKALLESAARPHDVYGRWYSRHHVICQDVIEAMTSVARNGDPEPLRRHLRRLDRIRAEKYRKQKYKDRKQDTVSSWRFRPRPELINLTNLIDTLTIDVV